jgi:hypothetical protein
VVTPRRWLAIAVASILALLAAYGAGRYAAPTKVVTKTETKTVTQVQYQDRVVYQDRLVEHRVAGPVRIVTKTIPVPVAAGCPAAVETIVTEDHGAVTTDTQASAEGSSTSQAQVDQTQETKTEKTVTRDAPRLTLLLSQDALRLTDPSRLAGTVTYRFLGPVAAGLEVRGDDLKHPRLVISLSF